MSIDEHPTIQRLRVAEYALELLEAGELDRLKNLLFAGTTFEFRPMNDVGGFTPHRVDDPEEQPRYEASRPGGYILSAWDQGPRWTMFYDPSLSPNEVSLLARCLGEIIAVYFAALGVDMSHVLEQGSRSEA